MGADARVLGNHDQIIAAAPKNFPVDVDSLPMILMASIVPHPRDVYAAVLWNLSARYENNFGAALSSSRRQALVAFARRRGPHVWLGVRGRRTVCRPAAFTFSPPRRGDLTRT
jgi:hypothetical protein